MKLTGVVHVDRPIGASVTGHRLVRYARIGAIREIQTRSVIVPYRVGNRQHRSGISPQDPIVVVADRTVLYR